MQVLVKLSESPQSYVRGNLHATIKAPACCPNCRRSRSLRALGYYERGIAVTGRPAYLRFLVRRFKCTDCRRTTSLLPDFSQPYRLVSNQIIDSYFRGGPDMALQWDYLLNRYRNRFVDWLPILVQKVRQDFRLIVPRNPPELAWSCLEGALGKVGPATRKLTGKSGLTLFGAYLCHQPCRCKERITGIHTTVLLRVGKDPPD